MVSVGLSWVLSFSNAVLGVGLLTLPYCYQECGVILATLMILFCGHLTKITCGFLLRAGIYTRKSSYEQLCLLVFGPKGKLLCEISMIGVTIGTLIAFQVVIGDLAPAIMENEFGFQKGWMLRTLMMLACCLLILPLCLMRSVASLAGFNTFSMTFYLLYVFTIFCISLPVISARDWWTDIYFWKSSELFKCLPIIVLAYNCQGQVFIYYAALPDPNVKIMTAIIQKSINLVNIFYIIVGTFGYIAFYKAGVKGNVLEHLSPGFLTDCMKLGFLLSVVISFPAMCFPVRSSINSLLFANKKQGILHDVITNASNYIAPNKFVIISLGLVFGTVFVGILIPQVEVVLSVTGALAGSFICLVYPTALFLKTGGKDKQRKFAVIILFLSVFLMMTCTNRSLMGLVSGPPKPVAVNDAVNPVIPATNANLINEAIPAKVDSIIPKDIHKEPEVVKLKQPSEKVDGKIPIRPPENLDDKRLSDSVVQSSLEKIPPIDKSLEIKPLQPKIEKPSEEKPKEEKPKREENQIPKTEVLLKVSNNKSTRAISPELSEKKPNDRIEKVGKVESDKDLISNIKAGLEEIGDKNPVDNELDIKDESKGKEIINVNESNDKVASPDVDKLIPKPLSNTTVVNGILMPNISSSKENEKAEKNLPQKIWDEKPLEVLDVSNTNISAKKSKMTREILSKS